jgi:hypothetical protein
MTLSRRVRLLSVSGVKSSADLNVDWIPSEDTTKLLVAASPGPWEGEAAREGRVMARRPISCPQVFEAARVFHWQASLSAGRSNIMRYCSVVLCLKRRKLRAAGSPPSIAAEINNRQRRLTSTSTLEDIHCATMRA